MMLNVFIFGTGELYKKNRERIRNDINIIGFLDNDKNKQEKILDGKSVYSPDVVKNFKYDFIFIMCFYFIV